MTRNTDVRPDAAPAAGARLIEVGASEHERIAAFKQGAIDYVAKLPDWARTQLYQKPFIPLVEGAREVVPIYLRDLAALVDLLHLPAGSALLDVACGPGWLSEAFYRFGYRVTGIDIAPDLLAIARARIASVDPPPIDRDPSWAEFLEVDIETARLDRLFDAAVIYDCLHHFVDARSALVHVRSMLSRDGVLIIKEGAKPAPGSEDERELLRESETYQTLESPFDPLELERLLVEVGFAQVTRLVPADPFVPAGETRWQKIRRVLRPPAGREVNFLVCRQGVATAPLPMDRGLLLRAGIELLAAEPHGDGLALRVRIENQGHAVWTRGDEKRIGAVCAGCRLRDAKGALLEEFGGRTPLPRDLGPGDAVELDLLYPWLDSATAGATLTIDLTRQGDCWFGELGSPVLRLDLPARP